MFETERTFKISDPTGCVLSDFAFPVPCLICLFVFMVMFRFIRPSGLDLGPLQKICVSTYREM